MLLNRKDYNLKTFYLFYLILFFLLSSCGGESIIIPDYSENKRNFFSFTSYGFLTSKEVNEDFSIKKFSKNIYGYETIENKTLIFGYPFTEKEDLKVYLKVPKEANIKVEIQTKDQKVEKELKINISDKSLKEIEGNFYKVFNLKKDFLVDKSPAIPVNVSIKEKDKDLNFQIYFASTNNIESLEKPEEFFKFSANGKFNVFQKQEDAFFPVILNKKNKSITIKYFNSERTYKKKDEIFINYNKEIPIYVVKDKDLLNEFYLNGEESLQYNPISSKYKEEVNLFNNTLNKNHSIDLDKKVVSIKTFSQASYLLAFLLDTKRYDLYFNNFSETYEIKKVKYYNAFEDLFDNTFGVSKIKVLPGKDFYSKDFSQKAIPGKSIKPIVSQKGTIEKFPIIFIDAQGKVGEETFFNSKGDIFLELKILPGTERFELNGTVYYGYSKSHSSFRDESKQLLKYKDYSYMNFSQNTYATNMNNSGFVKVGIPYSLVDFNKKEKIELGQSKKFELKAKNIDGLTETTYITLIPSSEELVDLNQNRENISFLFKEEYELNDNKINHILPLFTQEIIKYIVIPAKDGTLEMSMVALLNSKVKKENLFFQVEQINSNFVKKTFYNDLSNKSRHSISLSFLPKKAKEREGKVYLLKVKTFDASQEQLPFEEKFVLIGKVPFKNIERLGISTKSVASYNKENGIFSLKKNGNNVVNADLKITIPAKRLLDKYEMTVNNSSFKKSGRITANNIWNKKYFIFQPMVKEIAKPNKLDLSFDNIITLLEEEKYIEGNDFGSTRNNTMNDNITFVLYQDNTFSLSNYFKIDNNPTEITKMKLNLLDTNKVISFYYKVTGVIFLDKNILNNEEKGFGDNTFKQDVKISLQDYFKGCFSSLIPCRYLITN